MSFQITDKNKAIVSPLPSISEKTFKKMEKKVVNINNPLLKGIKDKKLSIKVI